MRAVLDFVLRDKRRIATYALGGIVATIFNLLATYLARMVTTYSVAVVVGAAVATVVSFLSAKFFVFRTRNSKRRAAEIVKFLCVHCTASIFYWLIAISLAALLPLVGVRHYAEAIASLIGVSSFAVTGFLGHRFITFAAPRDGR